MVRGTLTNGVYAYSLIYDVIQCSGLDGYCDNYAARKTRREAHRPMERIGGFIRSHWISPLGVFSRRIGPAEAMVIAVAVV